MYICDACGKRCNNRTNIFITLWLCDDCLDKWYSGELGKKKEDKDDEKTEVVQNGKQENE